LVDRQAATGQTALGAAASECQPPRGSTPPQLVVVGDLTGSGAAQEQTVVSENLAARLQAAAAPGSVTVDTTSRCLLGGLFEYRDLGGIEAKGFANRVQEGTATQRWGLSLTGTGAGAAELVDLGWDQVRAASPASFAAGPGA
jgi:class 3 adenylate cyclase